MAMIDKARLRRALRLANVSPHARDYVLLAFEAGETLPALKGDIKAFITTLERWREGDFEAALEEVGFVYDHHNQRMAMLLGAVLDSRVPYGEWAGLMRGTPHEAFKF